MEEQNLLNTLIDNLPDHLFVKDTAGQFVLTNSAQRRAMGAASPDDVIGKTDFDFFPRELAARYSADEQAVMQSGQALLEREEPLLDQQGQWRWMLTTKVPLYDSNGQITGVIGISRDITDRKRAEATQIEERQLLRTLIDAIPDHVFVKDAECRFLIGNVSVAQHVGAASPDELVGKTDFDFSPPELAAQYYADEQAIIRSGRPLIGREEPNVATDCSQHWFMTTKVPLRDSHGMISGLVGVSRDITKRKHAEEALIQARDELERRVQERTAELARANAILQAEIAERKRTEEALIEERNLLRTLIDNLPDYIYVKDADGRFILGNTSVAMRMGTQPDGLAGKTDFDFYPPALAAQYHASEQTILQTGQPMLHHEEPGFCHRTSEMRWQLSTKVPLRDRTGKITGLVGIGHDITDRKQTEVMLRRQALTFENIYDGIIITDTTGHIIDWNPGAERIYGYSRSEAIGQIAEFLQPSQPAGLSIAIIKTVLREGRWLGELTFTRKDGTQGISETIVVPMYDTDGQLTATIGVNRNVTERKQAEESLLRLNAELEQRVEERTSQLQREQTLLQTILDSMGEGVIYSEGQHIQYANRALAQLTGYRIGELIGQPALIFKTDKMSEEDVQNFVRSFRQPGTTMRGEVQFRRKDGAEFDAALTVTVLSDEADRVIGAVTIVRDVTEEKQLQIQKNRFIANASHELRTPLTNVKTRLYLLRKQPEKWESHMVVLERAADQMTSLIEDLLDVSRFERGVILLHRDNTVLQTLVADIVQAMQAEAAQRNITLTEDVPVEPLQAFVDPRRLTQVVVNLVVNAINYTPDGGAVKVGIQDGDGGIEIDVKDTGIGIAPEHLARVFEPFFRASEGSRRGTGLGLSIAREIVELHGGSLLVSSEPGKGSVFTVRLPHRPADQ